MSCFANLFILTDSESPEVKLSEKQKNIFRLHEIMEPKMKELSDRINGMGYNAELYYDFVPNDALHTATSAFSIVFPRDQVGEPDYFTITLSIENDALSLAGIKYHMHVQEDTSTNKRVGQIGSIPVYEETTLPVDILQETQPHSGSYRLDDFVDTMKFQIWRKADELNIQPVINNAFECRYVL